MAVNSNLNGSLNSTQFYSPQLSKTSPLIIVVLMLWLQSGNSMIYFSTGDICDLELSQKPRTCSYGSFTVNPDTRLCADREICYRGLGEPCKPNILEIRCARGLACKCGRCMNCMGGDCSMDLCPFEKNQPRLYNRIENSYN